MCVADGINCQQDRNNKWRLKFRPVFFTVQQLQLLSSSLAWQAVQYDMHGRRYITTCMAGGTARPSQNKTSFPHPSPSRQAGQDAVLGQLSIRPLCVDVNIPCGDTEAARGRRKYMNEGRKEVGAGRRAQILTPFLARRGGGGGRGVKKVAKDRIFCLKSMPKAGSSTHNGRRKLGSTLS